MTDKPDGLWLYRTEWSVQRVTVCNVLEGASFSDCDLSLDVINGSCLNVNQAGILGCEARFPTFRMKVLPSEVGNHVPMAQGHIVDPQQIGCEDLRCDSVFMMC
jgi:hypothetical protein